MENLYYYKYIKYKLKYDNLYEKMYGGRKLELFHRKSDNFKVNAKILKKKLSKYKEKNGEIIIKFNQLVNDIIRKKKSEIQQLKDEIIKEMNKLIKKLKKLNNDELKNLEKAINKNKNKSKNGNENMGEGKNNNFNNLSNEINKIQDITNIQEIKDIDINIQNIYNIISKITVDKGRIISNNQKTLNNIKDGIVSMNEYNNILSNIKIIDLEQPIKDDYCLNIKTF